MALEPVIGLEVHAELATETKLFCGCSTRFGAEPNTQTCPVCMGMPGVLPVVNRGAFELGLKTALALNCEVAPRTNFDRKNYYYPDLPKNYQISQSYHNLGVNGRLDIPVNGDFHRVRIWNVHLEEDAGKLVHSEGPGGRYSLVDLNRTGVPLVEIVSAPDMHSIVQVESYMRALRSILLYTEVSDCKMQEGSLRFEASVSVRQEGTDRLGSRVEIKNLNSMRAVARAVEYEVERQTRAIERGESVAQETRLWDEERGRSERMRTKEEAQDYRYFPEPDLVPVTVDADRIARVRETIPELPTPRLKRFVQEYGLSEYDARVLTDDRQVADYFEECLKVFGTPKAVCNWVTNEVLRVLNEQKISISEFGPSPRMVAALAEMVHKGQINVAAGRDVFAEMVETGKEPRQIVAEKGLTQISDENALNAAVADAVAGNPKALADWGQGKKNALNALVGAVMKATKGKANPRLVRELLVKKLGGGE